MHPQRATLSDESYSTCALFPQISGLFSRKSGLFPQISALFSQISGLFARKHTVMRKITLKQMLSHIVGNNKRVRICRSHWLFAFSLARTRAYTLEFYLFCCHICHRKSPKHCFSTSYQINQPLLTKQSIIHSWWQQIKGVFCTVSPPLLTIFSFTERRMWQMWQQNKQNHWVIRARETY